MRRALLVIMVFALVAAITRPLRPAEALKAPPVLTKSFSPASIPLGGTSTMTIVVTNPNTAITMR